MKTLSKIYSKEERKRYYEEWRISGLSQKDYCEKSGLNVNTFNVWVRRFSKQIENKFIPISVPKPESIEESVIELKLPSGVITKIPLLKNEGFILKLLKELSICK